MINHTEKFLSEILHLLFTFHPKRKFSEEDGTIKIKNALGFVGSYIDSSGIDHKIAVVHTINNNVGYQIIIDSTSEIFHEIEKEVFYILNSIKFKHD